MLLDRSKNGLGGASNRVRKRRGRFKTECRPARQRRRVAWLVCQPVSKSFGVETSMTTSGSDVGNASLARPHTERAGADAECARSGRDRHPRPFASPGASALRICASHLRLAVWLGALRPCLMPRERRVDPSSAEAIAAQRSVGRQALARRHGRLPSEGTVRHRLVPRRANRSRRDGTRSIRLLADSDRGRRRQCRWQALRPGFRVALAFAVPSVVWRSQRPERRTNPPRRAARAPSAGYALRPLPKEVSAKRPARVVGQVVGAARRLARRATAPGHSSKIAGVHRPFVYGELFLLPPMRAGMKHLLQEDVRLMTPTKAFLGVRDCSRIPRFSLALR